MNRDERIHIGFEGFRVAILPLAGGKISSIQLAGREMLQEPLTGNFSRSRTMPFDSGDASGWDECLPSVAPCRVRTDGGTAVIPDHGDLWRVAWQILETAATRCTMLAKCFSLPLELVRTATAERIDAVFRIRLDYRIRNIGAHTTPWAWSAHPLFAVQPGDRILLPESVKSLRVEASGGGRLSGCVVRWPIDSISAGLQGNLSIAQSPNSEIGDKLFAGPLHGAENWAVLERHSAHVRIRVTFDPAANPFLGLWLCYGGWPLRPGPKQMCVALEPSTSPVDSLASTGKWQRLLEPGESFAWTMTVELQQI